MVFADICYKRKLKEMSEGPSKSTSNEWTHAILPNPCGGDANTFFWGCCCVPCLTCSNARHLAAFPVSIFKTSDKTPSDRKVLCNTYCLLVCFCNPIATFLVRQTTREKYGIDGSDAEDAVSLMVNVRGLSNVDYVNQVCSFFCDCCVNCQTAAEIQARDGKGPEC